MVSWATPVLLAPKYIISPQNVLGCRAGSVDTHKWRTLWVLFRVLAGRARAAEAGGQVQILVRRRVITQLITARETRLRFNLRDFAAGEYAILRCTLDLQQGQKPQVASGEGLGWILGKISFLKEWSGLGPGCPGQWWSPHPWRSSKNV